MCLGPNWTSGSAKLLGVHPRHRFFDAVQLADQLLPREYRSRWLGIVVRGLDFVFKGLGGIGAFLWQLDGRNRRKPSPQ